ncbi:uncharacterized protein LOC126678239 [Mercurialis annua]|uniref:uncharacterized protein LOC126678239 n=1 Tax=Mercurialis annua TaxID=3986 RepID=UPI00215E9008|nr:uncharacterized protein LOC126678239 [Mercurialis annua]
MAKRSKECSKLVIKSIVSVGSISVLPDYITCAIPSLTVSSQQVFGSVAVDNCVFNRLRVKNSWKIWSKCMHNTRSSKLPLEPFQHDLSSFERGIRKSSQKSDTIGDQARHHDGYVPPFSNVDMIPPHHPQNVEVAPVQQRQPRNQNRQQQQAPKRRTLGEFFLPDVDHANFGCFAPPIQANTFEIKTSTISLLENRCQFYGLPSEYPNAHISKFLEVRTRNSITTWGQLAQAFLNKYFRLGKTARLTKEIIDFFQHDGEALNGAWERFNKLQRSCPHHHLQKEHLIQIFCNGINEHTRAIIDAASEGSIMRKTYEEALALLDELAINSSSRPTERLRQSNQKGMMTLEQIQELEVMKTKNAALQAQVDLYKRQRNAPIAAVQAGCEFCGDISHSGGECLISEQTTNEQVNYVGGQWNDPYSNTYNPGWRNHPNFSWKDTNHSGPNNANTQANAGRNRYQPNQGNFNSNKYGSRPQNPHGFQSNRNQDDGSKLDKILERFEKFEAEARQKDKNQAAAFHHLEGGLPSTTETNPKEQVKAVERRSGMALNDPHGKKPIEVNDEPNIDEASSSNIKASEGVIVEDATPEVRPPPPPPYVPKYAKFLKDTIMNKRSWKDKGTISLTENCSSIILSDLPTKLKDPGSFTIPCTIGNLNYVNCLCDLGASINLMPLFLFRNLFRNQSVKQTSMVLQLADQSIKKPYGVFEDVLVKVDKFIFPVDFVILDYAVDKN